MKTPIFWKYTKSALKKSVYAIRHIKNKEFLTFLLFLLISAIFWFLQNTQSTIETKLNIPVKYTEVPDNITITNKLISSVQVTLRDKGGYLYGYAFRRKSLSIEINLMNWRTPNGIGKIPIDQLEYRLASKLRPSTQILRISPDSIVVYFVEKESKTLPVHLNIQINPAPQYMLVDNPQLSPAFVTAYAPSGILDSLNVLETVVLKADGISDTTQLEVALKPIDGVQFSQEKIQVSIPIEAFTEQTFSIPVTGIHFPEGYELRAFPTTIQVSFLVCESLYRHIKIDDFQVSVDYQDILKSPNDLSTIKVIKAPKNIKRMILKPEKVDCLIEKIQ